MCLSQFGVPTGAGAGVLDAYQRGMGIKTPNTALGAKQAADGSQRRREGRRGQGTALGAPSRTSLDGGHWARPLEERWGV